MSTFLLCNCSEMDINYNNTPFFTSKENQLNWFFKRVVKRIDDGSYHRKNTDLKVNYSLEELKFCNYAITINENENKYEFYFIADRTYINPNVSLLTLRMDLIQTYLFDFKLGNCLLERLHTRRKDRKGIPFLNPYYYEENFVSGEYKLSQTEEVYNYQNKGGYIITSSDLLGTVNGGSSGGGESVITPTGNISENLLVFLKGYEAFSSEPYNIGDGTNTIGYGVTELYQPTAYAELSPYCTEQQASDVMYRIIRDNYFKGVWEQIDGVRENPKQNEIDAFVSLAYNAGVGGCTSSPMFQAYIQNKPISECASSWKTYAINEGTIHEQGLRNRRNAEYNMFVSGQYEFKTIWVYGGGYITDNNGKGYIPEEIKSSTVSSLRENIVNSARKLIGKPYVWGGNYPPLGSSNGTDCSGLCQWAYNDNGVSISRTTYTQINEGTQVTLSQLQPGDLVFSRFSSPGVPEHVYMFSGIKNGKYYCVEAQDVGTNILEREFTPVNTLVYISIL